MVIKTTCLLDPGSLPLPQFQSHNDGVAAQRTTLKRETGEGSEPMEVCWFLGNVGGTF